MITGEGQQGGKRPWLGRDLVLSRELEAQLADVVEGVRRARARALPLRHVLVHGPPGNGKSMAVEALCQVREAGMACERPGRRACEGLLVQ